MHQEEPKLKVLDLFSGIGGFSLGLERTGGFETVAFCEMKPHAQAVLAKNFPSVPCHDDVTTYDFKEGEADVITAGFPCQDISFAGDGAGLSGARSGLYREVIRALRVVRPKWAVLENVAALLSRGLDTVLGDMATVGYDAEWHCIPASAVGAHHRRDRIWIVAHPGGEQHEGSGAPLSGSLATRLSEAALANSASVGCVQSNDEVCTGRDATVIGGQVVADAQSERCDEARKLRHDKSKERIASRSEELADANIIDAQGLVACFADETERAGPLERSSGPRGDGLGWWATEPDVGRVAHGVPQKLDGGIDAEEEHAAEASKEGYCGSNGLPSLRGGGSVGAASPGLFEAGNCRSALQALPRQGRPARRDQEGEGNENMSSLRQRLHAETQQETFALQPGVSVNRWPHECGKALGEVWSIEPDVPRVAHDVPQRVDRLSELGNAVVPQIPELIGNAILASRRAAA